MPPQPTNRYRGGPAPPRPPVRPRRVISGPPPPRRVDDPGQYRLIDPDDTRRRRGGLPFWAKIAILVAVIAAAYLALKLLASGDPDNLPPQPAPKTTPNVATPEPPRAWEQRYDATLRYAGHIVVLRRLRVTQLNRKSPRVQLLMAVTPRANLTDSWLLDKRRFSLAVPNHYVHASSIKMTRHGTRRDVTVTFHWPKKYLVRGSRLMLQLPTRGRRPEAINIGVEMPANAKGIPDRSGPGRL